MKESNPLNSVAKITTRSHKTLIRYSNQSKTTAKNSKAPQISPNCEKAKRETFTELARGDTFCGLCAG